MERVEWCDETNCLWVSLGKGLGQKKEKEKERCACMGLDYHGAGREYYN